MTSLSILFSLCDGSRANGIPKKIIYKRITKSVLTAQGIKTVSQSKLDREENMERVSGFYN